MDNNVNSLIDQWEANYKKGLLSFWILLALSERPTYVYEMKERIENLSQDSISADENSLYRALRRFAHSGLVASELVPSDLGPPRRYFTLTTAGNELLKSFIRRNILVFETQPVQDAIQHILLVKGEPK